MTQPESPQSLRKLLPTPSFPAPQVVKHLPKAHILACAPSNSGADLLCQRLRVHLPSSIYRLLAHSRDIRAVPEDIKVPREVQKAEGSRQGGHRRETRSPGYVLCDLGCVRTLQSPCLQSEGSG